MLGSMDGVLRSSFLGASVWVQEQISSEACMLAGPRGLKVSSAQVLRKRLSLVEPTIRTDGGFEYEEGEGLDEDEVCKP